MIKILMSFCFSAVLAIAFGYLAVRILGKLKAKQSILEYVDNHKEKAGTPTMGGIIFLLPTLICSLIFGGVDNQLAIIALCVTIGYALIGFLDDYIKIHHKHNQGLKAYQKVIAQGGIAAIITAYAYLSGYVGSEIVLPFSNATVNIGWWYIPLCFVIYIATTNSVNLTDGLDGLAGNTSSVVVLVLGVLSFLGYYEYSQAGDTLQATQMYALTIFTACLLGGIIGFLWFNSHPAKVFMGDTGSLALGGAIATITIFIKNPLIILLLGIIYVLTSISVIVQVVYFKLTKGKRVFLMAPYHHHLQYKGHKETKIVAFYTIITIIAGVITIISAIV